MQTIYPLIYAGPQPPTDVRVFASACNTAVVSWKASQSIRCDAVIASYSVRYRLESSSGNYTTVSTSSTTAVLRDIVPNARYDVSVASINSNGEMSGFSNITQYSMQGNAYLQWSSG